MLEGIASSEAFDAVAIAVGTGHLVGISVDGLRGDGRCWARTSDLLLVRQALYQLS